jgi:hypothetical protein
MPISPQALLGLLLLVFLLEIALFWASTALGNVEVGSSKLLVGALLATLGWVGAVAGVWLLVGRPDSLAVPENRSPLLIYSALGLLVSWAVPAALFVPVLPVSVPRGMLVSVFQVLLRLFLYVLIGAVIMVVLAVLQIRYGPERPSGTSSLPAAGVVSSPT